MRDEILVFVAALVVSAVLWASVIGLAILGIRMVMHS